MADQVSPPPQPGPDPAQRRLEAAVRVGGALVAVGLVTVTVILVLYFSGASMPGTWAYFVVLAAPLGFALILVSLAAVAVRRRRAAIAGTPPTDPPSAVQPGPR